MRIGYKFYRVDKQGRLKPVSADAPKHKPGRWNRPRSGFGPITVIRDARAVPYWFRVLWVPSGYVGWPAVPLPPKFEERVQLWEVGYHPWRQALRREGSKVTHVWRPGRSLTMYPADFLRGRLGLARSVKPLRKVPLRELEALISV